MVGGQFVDERFKPKVDEKQLTVAATATQDWFIQKLDHFDSNNTATWKQVCFSIKLRTNLFSNTGTVPTITSPEDLSSLCLVAKDRSRLDGSLLELMNGRY